MTNRTTAAGVQQFSITIASGSTTGTVNLGTAVGAGAFINYGGINPSVTTDFAEAGAYLSWATGGGTTTITATRNTGTAGTVVITGSMTDGDTANLIKTVQQGTVSISASTSGTATVTAPSSDANSAIHFLGDTGTGTTLAWDTDFTRLTQSGTTVTATVPVSGTTVTGFCLIEFQSTALTANAVQRISASISTSVTSFTATITAVVLANTVTFYGGSTIATVTTNPATGAMRGALSATTTLTVNVNTASANAKTYNASAVEFAAGVLNSSVQRGTTTLTGVTSNSTSLASINETYSGVSWLGNTATSTTAVLDRAEGAVALGTSAKAAVIQNAGSTDPSGIHSTFATSIAASTAGNLLVIGVGTSLATITVSSVTDNKGQTWLQVPSVAASDSGKNTSCDIWYFPNTASGVTSVTVTYSAVGQFWQQVFEVTNIVTVSPVEAHNLVNNGASTTTPVSATITTTTNGDFVFVVMQSNLQSGLTNSVSAPYIIDSTETLSAYHIPAGTVTNETASFLISGGGSSSFCSSSAAFTSAGNTLDVVTVTKTTATANITGSWEVFEYPAFSAGTFNPGWTMGATRTIGGVF